jgi:uncharacterized Zn-binding protein involved in type VI secretion
MAASLLHVGATIHCSHGGQVSMSSQAKVRVDGQRAATLGDTFSVSGCSFQVPVVVGTKPQPCTRVQWLKVATRVRVNGQPVVLEDSSGICLSAEQIPQGSPEVKKVQGRVKAR